MKARSNNYSQTLFWGGLFVHLEWIQIKEGLRVMLVALVVLTNHERVTPMLSIKEGVMFYYKPPPHVGKHLGATTSSLMILGIMANDTPKNGL